MIAQYRKYAVFGRKCFSSGSRSAAAGALVERSGSAGALVAAAATTTDLDGLGGVAAGLAGGSLRGRW